MLGYVHTFVMPATLEPLTKERAGTDSRSAPSPSWNVVLLDDDDHTYDYVVDMLGKLLGHSWSTAWRHAREVDATGRAIVWSGEREVAELHQDRIHAYGADPRLARSSGSMTAILERFGG